MEVSLDDQTNSYLYGLWEAKIKRFYSADMTKSEVNQ